MFIGSQMVDGYTAEITKFSYTFSLDNGSKLSLKRADLVAFIETYLPHIDVTLYLDAVKSHLTYLQSWDLLHVMRFQFDRVIQKHYGSQLRELEFDIDPKYLKETDYEVIKFNELKESNGIKELIHEAQLLIDELTNNPNRLKPSKDFKSRQWVFYENSMVLVDSECTLTLNASVVNKLIDFIGNDFDTKGQQSLDYLANNIKNHDNFLPLGVVLSQLLADFNSLDIPELDYVTFANMLHKYKLPE